MNNEYAGYHVVPLGLPIRKIHLFFWRLVETHLLHIGYNADDLEQADGPADKVQSEALAEGLFIQPKFARHRIIHDRYRRSIRPIVVIEKPPAQQRNPHDLEIARGNHAIEGCVLEVRPHDALWLKTSQAQKATHATFPTKRQNTGKARAGYPRQCPDALQNCLEEVGPSSEIGILAIGHINLSGQHFVGPKPRVRFT